MGIHQNKYSQEYFTTVDSNGNPVGYGATLEKDENGVLKLRAHDQNILDLVDFGGKRVLDIGCGRGEALCSAFLKGATYCAGVDFAKPAVEIAKKLLAQRNLPEADLFNMDALSFVSDYKNTISDSNENRFDIVMMLDFVEHIPRYELRNVMEGLKKIISEKAIIVINTPAYKFDNDVIQNGFDERNLEDCYDTSDTRPETKGMHCNKYSNVSLQQFMSECGFVNLSEAHYFANKTVFSEEERNIDHLAYSERWKYAQRHGIPLKGNYQDDAVEFPYKTTAPTSLINFVEGNLAGLSVFLTDEYKETFFPGENYDKELFDSIHQKEIENQVVFDVGGFMGISSLIFAKLAGPSGRVITFEPNPWNQNRIFINLSHNQDLAQKILVFPYGLGDVNDQTKMTVSMEIDLGYSSTSRISISHPKIQNDYLPKGFFEMDVEVRTLDWFVETYRIIPNIIKVDIEGAEHFLLQGGIQTLTNHKPMLLIELHSEFCTLQCMQLLSKLGYIVSVLKEEADNRLMVKAIYHSQNDRTDRKSMENKLLDLMVFQNETAINYQRIVNREEAFHQLLQEEHKTLALNNHVLQVEYQSLVSEHQALQASQQALGSEHLALQAANQSLLSEHQALQASQQALGSEHLALQAANQSLLSEYLALKTANQSLLSEYQALQTVHKTLMATHDELQEVHKHILFNYHDVLNSKAVRYSSKIKEMIRKVRGAIKSSEK